jgi:hypothetical protein
MTEFNDFFKDEYIIKTIEKNHDLYKVIIHTYDTTKLSGKNTWNYTQALLYNGNNLIGSIKRNYSHLPYTFFKKTNRDYFISGTSYMSQTIIDCTTGQIYDSKPETNGFCWATYHQLDENTLCVCGCFWGCPYQYKIYDMTDPSKGWPELKLDDNIPKYCYIMFNHDVGNQKNYFDPVMEDGNIVFRIRETRIKDGDIDMEYSTYKWQDYYYKDQPEKIVKIDDHKNKKYYRDMVKLVLRRIEDTLVLVEFWRSPEQIEYDQDEEEDLYINEENKKKFVTNKKYQEYLTLLHDRYPENEYKYSFMYD